MSKRHIILLTRTNFFISVAGKTENVQEFKKMFFVVHCGWQSLNIIFCILEIMLIYAAWCTNFAETHRLYILSNKITSKLLWLVQLHKSNRHPSFQVFVSEAVAQKCSIKKVFLEISQKLHENTCARVSFLIKLQSQVCSFINRETHHRCFRVNFAKFLRKAFFTEHLRWLLPCLP